MNEIQWRESNGQCTHFDSRRACASSTMNRPKESTMSRLICITNYYYYYSSICECLRFWITKFEFHFGMKIDKFVRDDRFDSLKCIIEPLKSNQHCLATITTDEYAIYGRWSMYMIMAIIHFQYAVFIHNNDDNNNRQALEQTLSILGHCIRRNGELLIPFVVRWLTIIVIIRISLSWLKLCVCFFPSLHSCSPNLFNWLAVGHLLFCFRYRFFNSLILP